MIRTVLFALALVIFCPKSFADGNKMEDSFGVQRIEGGEAILSGKVKDLKAGDSLYFLRPPYEFKVKSVDADLGEVIVTLPASHDLKVGNALLRNVTPSIKKNMDTDKRLKEALSD